jgi:hypothetical protein
MQSYKLIYMDKSQYNKGQGKGTRRENMPEECGQTLQLVRGEMQQSPKFSVMALTKIVESHGG